jgi:hypothetical protein
METIIVYIDEAEWALQQLAPMACTEGVPAARWVLVACPPRMAQHVSKWLTHAARRAWRDKWSAALFDQVEPALRKRGHSTVRVIAKAPLPELTRDLQRQHTAVHVLDARRPKFGQPLDPVTGEQAPAAGKGQWEVPAAVAGMGAVLLLAAD